jgi:phage terminase small subunit
MIKSPSGYPVQSPYASVAAEIMIRIASEFGFTLTSRSRISTHNKAEPSLFDRLEDCPDGTSSAAETVPRNFAGVL